MLDFDKTITADIVEEFSWNAANNGKILNTQTIQSWVDHALKPSYSVAGLVRQILESYEVLCLVKDTEDLDAETIEFIAVAKRVNQNINVFRDMKKKQKELKLLEQINRGK